MQAEEGKIMNELGGRLMEVLGKYANQNGISLVMDTSNPQSPVIWADPSIDVTSDIVKLYDLAHPVAGRRPRLRLLLRRRPRPPRRRLPRSSSRPADCVSLPRTGRNPKRASWFRHGRQGGTLGSS